MTITVIWTVITAVNYAIIQKKNYIYIKTIITAVIHFNITVVTIVTSGAVNCCSNAFFSKTVIIYGIIKSKSIYCQYIYAMATLTMIVIYCYGYYILLWLEGRK